MARSQGLTLDLAQAPPLMQYDPQVPVLAYRSVYDGIAWRGQTLLTRRIFLH